MRRAYSQNRTFLGRSDYDPFARVWKKDLRNSFSCMYSNGFLCGCEKALSCLTAIPMAIVSRISF